MYLGDQETVYEKRYHAVKVRKPETTTPLIHNPVAFASNAPVGVSIDGEHTLFPSSKQSSTYAGTRSTDLLLQEAPHDAATGVVVVLFGALLVGCCGVRQCWYHLRLPHPGGSE